MNFCTTLLSLFFILLKFCVLVRFRFFFWCFYNDALFVRRLGQPPFCKARLIFFYLFFIFLFFFSEEGLCAFLLKVLLCRCKLCWIKDKIRFISCRFLTIFCTLPRIKKKSSHPPTSHTLLNVDGVPLEFLISFHPPHLTHQLTFCKFAHSSPSIPL